MNNLPTLATVYHGATCYTLRASESFNRARLSCPSAFVGAPDRFDVYKDGKLVTSSMTLNEANDRYSFPIGN